MDTDDSQWWRSFYIHREHKLVEGAVLLVYRYWIVRLRSIAADITDDRELAVWR